MNKRYVFLPGRFSGKKSGLSSLKFRDLGSSDTRLDAVVCKLKENERRLSTLMANLPGIAYRCVNDGRWSMEFVSQGCLELTGYTSEQLLGNGGLIYKDLIHPDDRHRIKTAVKEAFSRRSSFSIEYRIATAEGDWKWVLEQGTGIYRDDGSLEAFEGLAIDITDRKRAEESLRKNERRLQVKLDYMMSSDEEPAEFNLLDIINLKDLQKIQDAFAKALGVSATITNLDGSPITEPSNLSKVCSLVRSTSKGRERCETSAMVLGERARREMVPGYQECLSCGFVDAAAPIIVAGRHLANWVAGQCNVMGVDRKRIKEYALEIGAGVDEMLQAFDEMPPQMSLDKFRQVLDLQWTMAKEVSRLGYNNLKLAKQIAELTKTKEALLESEERFRRLVEHSLTGIFIIRGREMVYMNPEQERISDVMPFWFASRDLAGVYPEDRENVRHLLQSLTGADGPNSMDMEFRFHAGADGCDGGEIRWISCRGSSLEYGGRDAVLLNTTDVTRAKELAHMVQIQDKMTSLGRVAAGIAHEIRNPLSGINIYLNTIRKIHERGQGLEKAPEIISRIQSASNRIEAVIRRVMDFSKPGIPRVEMVDINVCVKEAVELSAVMLRKSGIMLDMDLQQDLPLYPADASLIGQVVLNFITNAAEAMRDMEGTKQVMVATAADCSGLSIRIADSGPGVDPRLKEKIFDPFFTTKSGNSGIGLSLSRRIIHDHGGRVTVKPGALGGAEFAIMLPVMENVRTN